MAPETALDDAHQTSIYIPYEEPDTDNIGSYTLFPDRDLPDGYELRLAAYKVAWSKCLRRVQELIHVLHEPIVDRVAELVNTAYTDTLLGLPYTELPVISVTVFGTSSAIFDEISARLETEGRDDLFDDHTGHHIVTHLFPQDCSNLTSAMKTLITGFINNTEGTPDSVKRKPVASLSTLDITLLQIWFNALCESRKSDSGTTRLVVILHDFEQFDPLVVQDLFEVSSIAIPRLPFIFILSLTSPSTPSYIHATYPRSTLSRLQVRSCSFSMSQDVLHDILLKTFFDVEFEPDIVLGPIAIESVVDFFGRHSPSLDGLISMLQLVHMKHFEEPLTALLAEENLLSGKLTLHNSAPFLHCILSRVQTSVLEPDVSADWPTEDVDRLLGIVRNARLTFQKSSKLFRTSFRVLLLVQDFMVLLGHRVEKTLPELMCTALRGRLGTIYRCLCTLVKQLRIDQLDELVSELYDFFAGVPTQVRNAEKEVISQIKRTRSVLADNSRPREAQETAEVIGEMLVEYFQRRLLLLDEIPLWDIWYTGATPFSSELLNPSLRASIFSGLSRPQDYDPVVTDQDDIDADDQETLSSMPDTSILFQRYLESGKMINVFDWFESFTVVMEAQKQEAIRLEMARESQVRTPTRRKGKQRSAEDQLFRGESQGQMEKWRLEIQARFIRSLHELDYIGLIKHTGRKVDHVMRTMFDVPS